MRVAVFLLIVSMTYVAEGTEEFTSRVMKLPDYNTYCKENVEQAKKIATRSGNQWYVKNVVEFRRLLSLFDQIPKTSKQVKQAYEEFYTLAPSRQTLTAYFNLSKKTCHEVSFLQITNILISTSKSLSLNSKEKRALTSEILARVKHRLDSVPTYINVAVQRVILDRLVTSGLVDLSETRNDDLQNLKSKIKKVGVVLRKREAKLGFGDMEHILAKDVAPIFKFLTYERNQAALLRNEFRELLSKAHAR